MHNSEYVGPRGAAQIQGRERRDRRAKRLKALGYRSYDAYLRSEHWAALKRRYYASDQPQDCICGETARLQLHHLTYEAIGEERLSDLRPLCASCHGTVHGLEARGSITLSLLPALADPERAERYAVEVRKAIKRKKREDASALAERKRRVAAVPFEERMKRTVETAKRRGIDLRSDMRDLRRTAQKGRPEHVLLAQLERMEALVYGWITTEEMDALRDKRLEKRKKREAEANALTLTGERRASEMP